MDKRFWGVILAIVLIFVGILVFNKDDSSTSSVNPTNHVMGNASSDVTLVEYGDYQCPGCGSYHPTVKQAVDDYKDKIQFQFRNLPLSQIHQNAFAAARAAEAASKQGKFWEMHDMLYENQDAWKAENNPKSIFEQYASQLGLNSQTFGKDYASESVNDLINADIKAFDKTGNRKATPTFFLNGKKVDPDNSVDAFKKLFDAELAKKQS